jgi:hypothetical protein
MVACRAYASKKLPQFMRHHLFALSTLALVGSVGSLMLGTTTTIPLEFGSDIVKGLLLEQRENSFSPAFRHHQAENRR